MGRKFTKYPSTSVNAATKSVPSKACYIDNYDHWVRSNYNDVLNNIMEMANRCLQGSGLVVPNTDAIEIADDGQLLGFSRLKRTKSGNEYNIGWSGGEWKLFIYDELSVNELFAYAKALDNIFETFNSIKFHQDRPIA